MPITCPKAKLLSHLPAESPLQFTPPCTSQNPRHRHDGRPNNRPPAAAHIISARGACDAIFLLLRRYIVAKPELDVSKQHSCKGGGCREDTADVPAGLAAEYHVGSATEWGECGGYYGEDTKWEGLGGGKFRVLLGRFFCHWCLVFLSHICT